MWQTVLVVMLIAGCMREARPIASGTDLVTVTKQPIGTPVAPAPRRFTQGEVLYIRHCANCHGWEGRGDGQVAILLDARPRNLRDPSLFTQYTEAELVARILHGMALQASIDPAALPHTEDEISSLLTYLQRLPHLAWQELEQGEQVYDSLCVSCHGVYGHGNGVMASSLPVPPRDLSVPAYQNSLNDDELSRRLSDGHGAMPGVAEVLSPQQVRTVITFVRLLSPGYELYDRFCVICHGPDGHPPVMSQDVFGFTRVLEGVPAFDQEYFRTHTPSQVRAGIQHMLKTHRTAMPHFAGALNADEARQIVTYLRTLTLVPSQK